MTIRYDTDLLPDIKVVGVGGGGCNAVNRMIRAKIPGVHFVACNTDAQALMASEAGSRIRIGEKLTKGLGVGGDPTRGERAADESRDELYDLLRGTEMVFVTAGHGRRHRHRRGARRRRDRQGLRRAHDRRRHQAVRLGRRPPREAGRRGPRPPARQGRYPHRHPELPPDRDLPAQRHGR